MALPDISGGGTNQKEGYKPDPRCEKGSIMEPFLVDSPYSRHIKNLLVQDKLEGTKRKLSNFQCVKTSLNKTFLLGPGLHANRKFKRRPYPLSYPYS